MRKPTGRSKVFGIGFCLLVGLMSAGCSPAVQPSTAIQTQQGTVVQGAWSQIQAGAQLGSQAMMYRVKINVDVYGKSLHSSYDVYGNVNVPNRVSLSIHENTNNVEFYQQGESAYAQDNGRWTQTDPIPNIDVFDSYIRLATDAAHANIPVTQLPDAYVVDEYCHVYQASVPAAMLKQLPLVQSAGNAATGDVQFVFFVGKTDHQLREIQSDSLSSVEGVGTLDVKTDTVLFSFDAPSAKITLPTDLVAQLENQ